LTNIDFGRLPITDKSHLVELVIRRKEGSEVKKGSEGRNKGRKDGRR
jgi:hypothetical protein